MNEGFLKKHSKAILIIGILLYFSAFIFIVQYYFNYTNNECVSDPFIFGAKQMEDKFGYPFIGTGRFLTPPTKAIATIVFNSTSLTTNEPQLDYAELERLYKKRERNPFASN